jgi:hypothetical protein
LEWHNDKSYVYANANSRHPRAFIARFPASSADEATSMVKKTLRYASNPPGGAWVERVVLAADNGLIGPPPDDQGFWRNQCENVKLCNLVPNLPPLPTFAPGLPVGPAEACPNAARDNPFIRKLLNDGAGIVAYRGHGESNRWDKWTAAGESWHSADIESPLTKNGCRTPVVFAIACCNGRLDRRDKDVGPARLRCEDVAPNIGEVWMRLGPNKAAVAHYGSAPVSLRLPNNDLNRRVFHAIYKLDVSTLAIICSISEAHVTRLWFNRRPGLEDPPGLPLVGRDNARSYQVFGDPFLVIRREGVGGFDGPEPPCCPGDVDGNGIIDQSDLGVVLSNWGCCPPSECEGDLDGDGCTGQSDLGLLLSGFGVECDQ